MIDSMLDPDYIKRTQMDLYANQDGFALPLCKFYFVRVAS